MLSPFVFEVSIKCAAVLPINSQSAPPSACVSDGDCFPWVSDEPVKDVLVRAFSVAKDVVLLGDMDVHSLGGGSRVRISLASDDEMVSWQERLVHARGHFSRRERGSEARGRSVLVEDSLLPIAEDPELFKGRCDQDGQEDELVARLLAPLCSNGGRPFRKLMRIHMQSPDTASDVHAGKTKVRSLMIGLDAGRETATFYELELGEVVTTFGTSGFGMETLEYKNLSFTVWGVGGHDKVRSLWRHFYQGTNGLIYVVNSNDRNKVVDAQEELNKLIEDEMRNTVVLAFANSLTSSTAARSSQDLTDVRETEDPWWCCADGSGGNTVVTCNFVQDAASGDGLGQTDVGYGNGCGNGKMVGGGSVPPPAK